MKLRKSFSIYTFVGFFGAGIGFFVMPILTHYLTPEDYGTLSLFNTYVMTLMPFIGIVATGLISLEYYNKNKTINDFRSLFSSISVIPIIPFVLFLIISIVFRNQLALLIDIPSKYIFLIPVLAFLTIYMEQTFNFLVITKNALTYGISNISKVVLEVSLTLFFIIGLDMNWQGRIGSSLLAVSVFGIFSFFYFRSQKLLTTQIKKHHIKAGIAFGSPLVLHVIGKLVVNQSDRIFIAKMISLEEVGIYNSGYIIGTILLIISGVFMKVYSPFLYERLADITEKKKIEIVRFSYGFVAVLIAILLFITLAAPFFYEYFIDIKYIGGIKYVFWIGLSYLFWGGYLIFSGYVFYLQRTKILSILSILNVVLNLGLNYLLIGEYGAIGAAYATALSFFVILVCIIAISARIYPMPWLSFKKIVYGDAR